MKLGDCEFSQITTVKGHHNKSKRLLQRQKPLGWMGLLLIEKVLANQHLHQLVPVDLADHAAGIVIVGDVGGVLGQQVTDNLIDGIVAFFSQGLIHIPENPAHIFFVIAGYSKFHGALFRHGLGLLSQRMLQL